MPLTVSDLKLYGSASMPDDDTATNVGGAIATSKKLDFTDNTGGLFQAVSSSASDTTQTVTPTGRDVNGTQTAEGKVLTGTSPVSYTTNFERILKGVKSATTAGDVAIEAQTAERSNTAQAGTANTITLDAGASAADDFYNGMVIRLTGGAGVGQIREVYDYTGSTKQLTVSYPWSPTGIPNGTTTFRISRGLFFDRTPVEITEIRRPFYSASANAPGGGAVSYYEKAFFRNSSSGLSLLSAQVTLPSDPSSRIRFGLAATINDTGGNGGGNNRKVAPAGIVFGTSAVNVPGTDLLAGSSIGVWLQLALLDGDAANKLSATLQLSGSTI